MTTQPRPAKPQGVISIPLGDGEVVWWSGSPQAHVYAQRAFHHLVYGSTWLILGSFWYYGSGGLDANSVFEGWWRLMPLGSLPFMITGMFLLYAPVLAARRARFTSYLVTNKRAIIQDRTLPAGSQIRSYLPNQLSQPEDRIRWDGWHDLILTKRFQELPHLLPALDAAFLGQTKQEANLAKAALSRLTSTHQFGNCVI